MADSAVIETQPCMVCGKTSKVILTIEEWQRLNAQDGFGKSLYLIQDALPNRDADFRELVKMGTHSDCWNEIFAGEED